LKMILSSFLNDKGNLTTALRLYWQVHRSSGKVYVRTLEITRIRKTTL
ncbi:hypothetical protein T4A_9226, partial [Trichinella pseudospiralis]